MGWTTTFQLSRTVSAQGTPFAFVEPVYALNGAPADHRGRGGGERLFSVGAYADRSSSPARRREGAAIAWSGGFLFWCRFSQDTALARPDGAAACGAWTACSSRA